MSFDNFTDLDRRLTEMFQEKQFEDALDLITREGAKFPDERVWVDYWHMCTAARLEDFPLVYKIVEDALARGMWYAESIWRTSPSFEFLQGDPKFEKIVAESKLLQEIENPKNEPLLLLNLPENHTNTSPILIGLHGNETSAEGNFQFWRRAVTQGWVVASPQSNQALYAGAYVWNDLDTAYTNIQEHYVQLQRDVSYDSKRVIIAGYSLGSLVAIQVALKGIIDVCGFIALCPIVPEVDQPDTLQEELVSIRNKGLRGYLIAGENDNIISKDGIYAFTEKLQSAGINCISEIIPGAAHDFSVDYEEALLRAISYIDIPS